MIPKIEGYEILQHLATGGMGRVFLARSRGPGAFERHLVLKTLDGDLDEDDPRVAMFLDEARVVGRMHHQHIAPAFAVGQDDEGQYYLVMDYIHGKSAALVWDRTLDLDAALPLDFAVTVTAAAASALHYAHTRAARDGSSLSIIHRDVSLSNLMIGYDGAIKLIDFGIVKTADASTMTQVGFVKGKLGYMAPEQISGARIDHRTDIFALGIVLYELSTMTRAFREESDLATIERIKKTDYVFPSRLVSEFPRELERIIAKALHRNPAERYQDAETMRAELAAFGHRQRLVVGDDAIIQVMTQLFEDRAEPWALVDGTPGEIIDGATIPVDTTADRAPPRRDTPRPLVRHIRAATEIIELTPSMRRDETPTVLQPVSPHEPSATARPAAAIARSPGLAPRSPQVNRSSTRWLLPLSLLVLAACAVAAVAISAGWFPIEGSAPMSVVRPPDASTIMRSEPIILPPDASVDAARTTVQLRIRTTPADATVLLDGDRLGKTPLDAEVAVRPGLHVIKVRRRGYLSRTIEVSLTTDVTQELTLERGTD